MIDIGGKNYLNPVQEMYAFLSREDGKNEALCAFLDEKRGTWMPMVGADIEVITRLKRIARQIAKETKKEVILVKFSTRTELESFK